MRWSEGLPIILAFDWHLSCDFIRRIFLIDREGSQRHVVTLFLGWLRRPEWFIMLVQRGRLGFHYPLWDERIFSNDVLGRVKSVSPLHSLREWFLLHEAVRVFPFSLSKHSRSIELIWHVGDLASERDV